MPKNLIAPLHLGEILFHDFLEPFTTIVNEEGFSVKFYAKRSSANILRLYKFKSH